MGLLKVCRLEYPTFALILILFLSPAACGRKRGSATNLITTTTPPSASTNGGYAAGTNGDNDGGNTGNAANAGNTGDNNTGNTGTFIPPPGGATNTGNTGGTSTTSSSTSSNNGSTSTSSSSTSTSGNTGAGNNPPPPPCGVLPSGGSLLPGQHVRSCNALYTLLLQQNGILALYKKLGDNPFGELLWYPTAAQGTHAEMQGDGNFVIYNAAGAAVFNSGTGGHPGALLKVLDNGNVAVLENGNPLWSSGTDNMTKPCTTLATNTALAVGERLQSCDARFRLVMQANGFATLIAPFGVAWQTPVGGGASLKILPNGNLVLLSAAGAVVWQSGSSYPEANAGAYLAMQNDGNLVVYAPGHSHAWASNTANLTIPCGVLTADHGFAVGERLNSCDGRHMLLMQNDGNLVVYSPVGPVWASSTNSGARATMQGDGNFVLRNAAGAAIFSTGTHNHPGAVIAMQNDGNLVVYAGNTPIWDSRTYSMTLRCGVMTAGHGIRPGQRFQSCSGRWSIAIENGRVVERGPGDVVRVVTGPPMGIDYFVMQGDGNLVGYAGGAAPWASDSAGYNGASLYLGDDGVLRLISGSTVLWSFPLPCGQLPPNHRLTQGQSIGSCDGRFSLVMQTDGNLVLYSSTLGALWASGTVGNGAYAELARHNGLLYVVGNNGAISWHNGITNHAGAMIHLQNDGNLVEYHGAAVWHTRTNAMAHGCGTLRSNEILQYGERFQSCNSRWAIVIGGDGNVVLWNNDTGQGFPALGVNITGAVRLAMQTDGNLVAYRANWTPAWDSHTWGHQGAGATFSLGDNGVRYVHIGGWILWSAGF